MFQNIFLTQADMENYLLVLFTFTYTNMNNMTNKLKKKLKYKPYKF